jgi:putative membrane protein
MTTASTAKEVPFRDNRLLQVLAGLFVIVFLVSGYRPLMPADWWVENGLVIVFAAYLIGTYRWLPMSQTSYVLIFVYLCMHEWGAHYRYGIDPVGEWMKQFQATSRNQFDRWVHLSFGLLMYYPYREILVRRGGIRTPWANWIPVMLLLAHGAGYELLEWGAAAVLSPETAEAFLALQGDPWDAHKDMMMAFCGAIAAMGITCALRYYRRRRATQTETLTRVKVA